MNSPLGQVVGGLLLILVIFVYPAVCLSRIAARLGRNPTPYALGALIPLGSLVLLGVLAFSASPPAPAQRRS